MEDSENAYCKLLRFSILKKGCLHKHLSHCPVRGNLGMWQLLASRTVLTSDQSCRTRGGTASLRAGDQTKAEKASEQSSLTENNLRECGLQHDQQHSNQELKLSLKYTHKSELLRTRDNAN